MDSGDRRLILFSKKWFGEIILFALPVVMILINSNWIFTPVKALPFTPFQDTWFYTGNFFYFFDYSTSGYTASHYFIERLPWNLLGFYFYHWFSPLVGNYLLHLLFYYMAVYSTYIVIKELITKRSALIAAMAIGSYPWFLRAVGWDYVDGAGIGYYLLALALLVLGVKKKPWKIYMLLAGAVTACLVFTNLFWIAFLPGLLIVFIVSNHIYQKRNLFSYSFYLGAGFVIITGLFCVYYYYVTGNFVFFKNSISLMGSYTNSKVHADYLLIYYRGMEPYWLVLPSLLVVAAGSFLLVRHGSLNRHRYLITIALIVQFLLSSAWLIFWHISSLPYLLIFLYASYLIPSGFLVFGALIDPLVELLTERQYALRCLVCFIVFVGPFLFSTVLFRFTKFQGELILIGLFSFSFIIALLFPHKISLIVACISIAGIGFVGGADANVFIQDRWKGRDSFLSITETVKLIDELYPEDYRNLVLMYDSYNFNIPGMAIGGIYQDLWSNKILFKENNPISWNMIEPGIGHDILLISEYENTFSDLKKTFENNSDIMNFDLIKTVPIRYGEMKFYLTFFRMEVQPEAVDLKHDEAFEFNYPVKSVNLHFPEITSDGKTFEWVGPETETKIYVQLPVSKNDISLSICALKIQDEITTGLKVSINSVPIQIVTTSTVDCPVMIYGVVPTEAISRNHSEIELLLKTAYTISPAEAGTNPWDPRKVSLGLDWMRIER